MNADRLFATVALLGFVVSSTSCSQNQPENKPPVKILEESQIHKVQPKAELFEIDGIKAPADASSLATYAKELSGKVKTRSLLAGTPVSYTDIIQYGWIACQADWDVTCEGDYGFNAPPGYQVCKMLYTITSQNNSQSVTITPTGWYENDSEHPARFRGYALHLFAGGDHNPLTQKGSNIRIDNVGIRVIDASQNNFARYATGCDMPAH
jgi:hypothetical protein